jgi:acyl-CoA thioesterase YciA
MLRTFAFPADANPQGDIFGGWLLGQMDIAGASLARRRAHGRVTTVAVAQMAFRLPVFAFGETSAYTASSFRESTGMRVRPGFVFRTNGRTAPSTLKCTIGVAGGAAAALSR